MPGITKPSPSFRLAKPSDIERIGIICTAGFFYSPIFKWERPHHTKYPNDTLLSYCKTMADAIKNETSAVFVALDEYSPRENEYTAATIANNDWNPPKQGEEVPVAVAWLRFPPDSPRCGKFQSNDGPYPELPENKGRDLDQSHYDSWGQISGDAKRTNFPGYYVTEMLVTHPAYWNRGHASQLVKTIMQLAREDQVRHGVNATDMGAKLCKKLGFERIREVNDPGTKNDATGAKTTLYMYIPQK